MSKPLLLATVFLCLFSVEASAHGHRQHHYLSRHAYRHHVDQRHTFQGFVDQNQVYQRQTYRQTPARNGMSDQADPMQQARIAPQLSGSYITASRSFARGYHRHLYQPRINQASAYQASAYQTSGDQRPLSYRRYARAWCGAYLSAYLGKNDRNLALARNWAKEGTSAGGPGIGVVVVWPHHVGIITGQAANGEWIVHSGNDGGAVRTRGRSLRGAIAFRRV
jgi:hypothetical protein